LGGVNEFILNKIDFIEKFWLRLEADVIEKCFSHSDKRILK